MSDFSKVTDAAKGFVCDLYKNVPRNVIPVISDIQQFYWDGLCGDPPADPSNLPLPPAPPFEGGQCCDAVYRVTTTLYDSQGRPYTTSSNGLGTVQGTFIKNVDAGIAYWYVLRKRCGGELDEYFAGSAEQPSRCDIVAVTRPDGQPDNCGNPPPEFPPAPPVPPGGYTSPPIPITLNNNNVINVEFNFNPPAASPPNQPPTPPTVNYIDTKFNFKIPITFNFDGTINFGGGGGGDIDFNIDDRDNIEEIKNVTTNNKNEIEIIRNTINNITNNYNNKPSNPNDFEPSPPPVPPGEYYRTFLHAVELVVRKVPKNAKTQSGSGAPDVVYAGWFEWRKAGFNLPRQPIHFQNCYFLAPSGIDGYAYTLYDGFEGDATEVINKEKVE